MTDKEQMLQEAVEAGQSGDLPRARELLLQLLNLDNREPLYWLLMSTAVDSREERIYCLHNVLKLDPENSAAKHDLNLLNAPLPGEEASSVEPQQQEDWQTSEIAAPTFEVEERLPREEPWPLTWILGSLGLGLVIILLGYYAAANGLIDFSEKSPTVGASTPSQNTVISTAVTSTPTPQATATRQVIVAPRDPNEMLSATYTPTPRYVNTPHTDSESFARGMQAFEAGDWEAAISAFEEHLRNQPNSADAAYHIGEAYLRLEDFEAARDSFEQAIAIDQQFAPGYLGRAQADLALGEAGSGPITDLNTAVLLDPNLMEVFLLRASYYLARGDEARALEDLDRAEALKPFSPVVHASKAKVYIAQENYLLARTSGLRALELDLTLLSNYLVLAEAHLALGEATEAVSLMQTYLTFEAEDAAGWELLGVGFENSGESASALDAFDRALAINPELAVAAYYRGLAYHEAGNNSSALALFQVAVKGAPDWFEARIALAQARLQSGNAGSAFFEVNASSNLIETDVQRAAFHYWRATILETLGQPGTALPDWLRLLTLPAEVMPAEWRQMAEQRAQSQ